jgi:hypothetical protein
MINPLDNKRIQALSSQQGSALLVALLLMGFLAVFGVGMSQLIVNSIRIERNVVESGKAYFAAEAGVEQALYDHQNRLPGYEPSEEAGEWTLANNAEVNLEVVAAEETVPCEHRDDEWRELGVQESVSWPLFRWDDGGRLELEEFKLNYSFERPTQVDGSVLRWKILGLTENGNTQAISGLRKYSSNLALNVLKESDTENFYAGEPGGTFFNDSHHQVITFLRNHQFNYLTLTNVTEPNAQQVGSDQPEDNVLQVKMKTEKGSACEYALVKSTGLSGGTRQSIDAQVKLDSFLPVFDFVLYQVDSE